MKRQVWNWTLTLLGAVAVLAGCNKTPATPSATEQAATQPAAAPVFTEPKQISTEAAPDQVVSMFLESMKVGDAPTIEALLTTKAREETRRHQMPVEPMAAPNAQFQVAAPVYLPMNPDGAHIQAQWVETDGMHNYTHSVIWVLRRETAGWRIAGFAIELIAGQGPQFLNFEDPADMMNKYKEAVAASEAAAQQPAVQQATQPAAPGAPVRQ